MAIKIKSYLYAVVDRETRCVHGVGEVMTKKARKLKYVRAGPPIVLGPAGFAVNIYTGDPEAVDRALEAHDDLLSFTEAAVSWMLGKGERPNVEDGRAALALARGKR